MDKLLSTTYTCHCGCNPTLPENLLKITAGNDFSIELILTEKDGDAWVHYDMTDMDDVIVSVVSPNNTPTELEHIINEEGDIVAVLDSEDYDSYIIYGIEVIWRDNKIDRRAFANNVFAFVNSSAEATDSSYEYTSDNPYEFNIQMENNVVYLSIGRMQNSDDYYTKSEIDTTLSSYVTYDALDDTLSSYATIAYVQEAISYVEVDTTYYYTKSEIDTKLNDYGTALNIDGEHIQTDTCISKVISLKNLINGSYNLSSIDLTAFKKKINNDNTWSIIPDNQSTGLILRSDVQMIHLDNERISAIENAGYITQSDLTNNSYATQQYVTDAIANIPTPTGEVTYAFLNEQSYVQCYTSSYIYELTQSEFNTLQQNDELDESYLYYITDAAPAGGEVTYAWLDQCAYVTHDYLDQQSYASSNNVVTLTDTQNVTGCKVFKATDTPLKTGHGSTTNIDTLLNADLMYGIHKGANEVRPTLIQAITGEILLPNRNVTDSSCNINTEIGKLKIYTVPSIANTSKPNLTQIAAMDDQGIYEGTTLLANKYTQSSTIRTITQISQSDYDDLVLAGTVDANTLYIIL